MASVLNIRERIRRWRHGRGFGIHSPFAYRFITEVLRCPYAYYGYAEVGSRRDLRLIIRLVAYFKPQKVYVQAEQTAREAIVRAVRVADSRVQITDELAEPDMVIVDFRSNEDKNTHLVSELLETHNGLVLNSRGTIQARGMTFNNGHGTIVVANYEHLPQQKIQARF